MGAEHSAQPASGVDEAIDAIVYDQHPALLSDYPYYSRQLPRPTSEGAPVGGLLDAVAGGVQTVVDSVTCKPDYIVPKRFGMSAMLGIMTALAGLFGILRFAGAEPYFYAFFAIESLAICVAQMFSDKAPRLASVGAGAVILPLFTIVAAGFSEHVNMAGATCAAIGFIPVGALLGYLTGTCAAGVFLVMDRFENYFKGQPLLDPAAPSAPKAAA